MNGKNYFEIVIAGVTIRFHSNHQADTGCLEDIFLYHKYRNTMPYKAGKIIHNVVIISSSKGFEFPKNVTPVWDGFINAGDPITTVWHNSNITNENFITVGRDILIHHISDSKLTICYLQEKKNIFKKSFRPMLSIYVFLLTHNILSMYGRYSIHSSCAAKNGLAYLFLGKSGNGKTTISTILGKAGFDYMGDDLVFISRDENGEIVADSFLCDAKIVTENLKSKKTEKEIIDVIKEYDFTHSYHQKLGGVFLLRRDFATKTSTLQPVSQENAYACLIHSGNHIKMQYNPHLWLDICEQVTTLPCYNLIFGNKEYFNPEIFNDVINK